MKYILIIATVLFTGTLQAQFTGTDSLRNYNNRYITNNPATAFTNLRLHTLLRGMIDYIDTARAGTGGGGAVGVDTLWALNDSTVRYRKNGVFKNFIVKGVYDTRRKVDTMYRVNDTTIGFTINNQARTFIIPGRTNYVDSIYRKSGQDSIFYRIVGVEYAIKDSSGATIIASNGLTKAGDTIKLGGYLTAGTRISGGVNGFPFQIDSTASITLFSGLEYISSGIGSVIQMSDSVMNISSSSATDFTSFVFSPTRIKFTAADGAGSSGDVWTNTGSGYGHWAPPDFSPSDTANKWINDLRRRPGTDTVEKYKNGNWQFAYKDSVGGGGGSQTFPQVLATGRTFSANDSALLGANTFKFKDGNLQADTLLVTASIKMGTTEPVDSRLKVIIKDNAPDTTGFAAIELKTINDDPDLNVDGATIVKHDSAYNLTPGYGNTLQVYTLAGSDGTIIGNNNYVGVTTPYAPTYSEVSNGYIRFELGPLWPRSEKMRLNNRGDVIFGWTIVRSHLASQSGTTVNDPVNTFSASDVGKFFCWGDRDLGGTAAFADRITGYIDANNITVETNRTIAAQGGRVCYANAIVDTLGNALYRYVSLDSIKFATGNETSFFKLKTMVDTFRVVREGTATDAAFDVTNGITLARLPRDIQLMGSTYSKLHFRDATHTLSDITANSTATAITTLDNLPINFNPNNSQAATITSTKVQNFKPTIISGIADAPIAKLDVRNPDANISMYVENSRASGTNYGAIIDVTAASSENRALYATANSGTVNKAIMVPGSSASGNGDFGLSIETTAKNYLAGKLGINTTSPIWGLDVNSSIGANKDSIDLQSMAGTRQMLVIDTATGKFQRMDIPGGGGITGSGTSGRIAYWDGSSSLTSNANFLFNGSVFSTGTTNTQGQLNVGGSKNLTSSGAQSYFAAATYTDNVTSASGTASSFSINLIAAPTIAATNSSVTFPSISTLTIDKPVAGTNATIQQGNALFVNGPARIAEALRRSYTGITTNTTLNSTHDIVAVSAASGNVDITLPSASNNDGLTYTIKRTDNSGNTVTVIGTIDGATNYSGLSAQYKYVTVVSNGTNWYIIANN